MCVYRQEGVTALHTAVQAGHEPVVRALLAGADRTAAVRVDAPRHDGVTPLALAAQTGAAHVRVPDIPITHPHRHLTIVSQCPSRWTSFLAYVRPFSTRLSSPETSLGTGQVSYPALG